MGDVDGKSVGHTVGYEEGAALGNGTGPRDLKDLLFEERVVFEVFDVEPVLDLVVDFVEHFVVDFEVEPFVVELLR